MEANKKQFNPQPGDKIICMNGEEFICCTLQDIQKNIYQNVSVDKYVIFGYRGEYISWQGWYKNGDTRCQDAEYAIREVIPQKQEQSMPKETEIQPEVTYSVEDIRKAVITDLGWQDLSLDLIMKSLEKVTSEEYNEYLRLKSIFEGDEEDL